MVKERKKEANIFVDICKKKCRKRYKKKTKKGNEKRKTNNGNKRVEDRKK